ncbi:MAG: hypothetical protein ABI759_25470 [Candidatus Solibacter sp.]
MKFPWRSAKGREPEAGSGRDVTSEHVVASRAAPGVSFTIARVSFDRRMELMRRVRDLARRSEFLAASTEAGDKMDAALVQAEIERVYVLWGVKAIAGLRVNGRPADVELLIAEGPEDLFREALAAARSEVGLHEEERKNC